jgi:hypothetical protein
MRHDFFADGQKKKRGLRCPRRADIALKMAAASFHPKWCRQAGMAIPVRSNLRIGYCPR